MLDVEAPISTKAAILAALAEESGYGSAIMDRVAGDTEGKMTLHSGSVYPALVSLEREGFIRKRKDLTAGSTVANRACYYELTKKGRDLVEEHRRIAMAVFSIPPPCPTGMSYTPL